MNISPNTPSNLYLSNYENSLNDEMKELFRTLPGGILYEKDSICLKIETPACKAFLLNLTNHQINVDIYGTIRFDEETIYEEIPECHIIFYKFEDYPEKVCSILSYINSQYFHEAVFEIKKKEEGFNISKYRSACDLKTRIGTGSKTIYPLSQVFSQKVYEKRKEHQKQICLLLLSENILIKDVIFRINFIYDMLLSLEFPNLDI